MQKKVQTPRKPEIVLFLILIIFTIGFWVIAWRHHVTSFSQSTTASSTVLYKTKEEQESIFVRFDMEAYDSIHDNYWKKSTDEDMAELFQLSFAKAASSTISQVTKDRAGTAKMLQEGFASLNDDVKRKELALNTLAVVLYNLPPTGRNGVLTNKAELAFRDTVSNIDRSKNLYDNLGLAKGAPVDSVNQAYTEKKEELQKVDTKEAHEQLKQVEYAHSVLANNDSKLFYDKDQIEPTVFTEVIQGKTLYVHLTKIAPTTLREFGLSIVAASSTKDLDSMIIDLRGNIGGALDFASYFLGLFIGEHQYAFDLFHQGDYSVHRTMLSKLPELSRYKEIALLTDTMTQSTAELLSATFKKFKIGIVIGNGTRGWGTVENTYPLRTVLTPGESYSLLLVNSITLRDDGEPIEGRGIDPDIDIRMANWEKTLPDHFHLPSIIKAIKAVLIKEPTK
jgi:C-terminal processing protease CtpA/Prc